MEQRERRACADVGAQAQFYAMVCGLYEIEQPRAEEQVRGRAYRDARAGLRQSRAFTGRQVDAVREDRARADETEPVIGIEIVARAGETVEHGGAFPGVFGQMRVKQDVGVSCEQFAGQCQLLVGRGQRETGGDGVAQPALPAPFFDQHFGFGVRGFDGVLEAGGAQVHQHFAADDPHVARLGRFEQRVDRVGVDGCENQCAGRAVTQQFVTEVARNVTRMRGIGEGRFSGEDVPFQPVEELFAISRDAVHLRVVDMRIDEAGHDQAGQMFDRHIGEAGREIGIGAARDDDAVFDDQQTVGVVADGLRIDDRVAAYRQDCPSKCAGHQSGSAVRNARTTWAELTEARCMNVSMRLASASPPARSDRLRNTIAGVVLA